MKDWRGNTYKTERLWHFKEDGTKTPVSCDKCQERQAVRNCCLAEGDIGRTHWHGAVHTFDRHLSYLCEECWEEDAKKFDTQTRKKK